MFTVRAGRRDFLRFGSLGALGLALPGRGRAATAGATPHFGRAKRCVLLFLTGGPPQHDTFDPKPDAPAEVRGELRPVATAVPGLRVSELFPRVAARAGRVCVVRSVTHHDTVHTSAGYAMLTGSPHPRANAPTATDIRPGAQDHPHLGALLALARPSPGGVPAFVSVPEVIKDDAVNTYPGLDGGFLGASVAPFLVTADADRAGFRVPAIDLPADVPPGRLRDRRALRDRLGGGLPAAADLDAHERKAIDLLGAAGVRRALDVEREPPAVRDAYGRHLFGQGCLLARRLVEAGVGLVGVYWHYEGPADSPVWDTHANNYPHMRNRLAPPADAAVAALLDDLHQRGLLGDTLVVVMGEFGRTPRVNGNGGRDHWPHAQSVLLAGAGVAGGAVYGATDRLGARPAADPVSPADLAATALHLLGVPADLEVRDRTGRPLRACDGTPVAGVLA